MYAPSCSRLSSATTVPSSLSSASMVKSRGTISTHPCPNFLRSNFVSNRTLKSSRLKISHTTRTWSKHVCPVLISCLADNNIEEYAQSGQSSIQNDSTPEPTIDIKLPRRSLLVHFTCNACGERSQRLVNRLAYEKGTVFVQCSGCSQYHKLVDNLNLVVEYDFREEATSMNSDTDQA